MGTTGSERITKIDVSKPAHKHHSLKVDTRGRVTIPKSVRSQYNIDPEDDKEYWIDLEVKTIEVREGDKPEEDST